MTQETDARLPTCFAGFPGAVLHVSPAGEVVASNGRLEAELGRTIVGRTFAEVLDAPSCGEKWARALAAARRGEPARSCELVLVRDDIVHEPRRFSVLWDAEPQVVWLVEHPTDPQLDRVRDEVTGVNSELASTQRDLVRERGRLAHALATEERLAGRVKEQNAELASRNQELLAMTEELEAQRRNLERSNRVLDEFAHAISHDLKAPLRSVANYARWIEEDLGDQLTGEPRGHLELLRSQVERMRTMITGVLEYARSTRTRSAAEPVDVNVLVAEVIALLDPPSTCTIVVQPDLPTLPAERAPLRQVLLNLIGNAIKYTQRPDARVDVGVRDTGTAYEFHVRDNGPGVPPRAQEKIWMLFHSIPSTVDGARDSTGVGLSIVRQLVELQGGRAWVDSEVGKGATFYFTWPKRPGEPVSPAPARPDTR